jgi:hypothetical protein
MSDGQILAERHSLAKEIIFSTKIVLLRFARFFKNTFVVRTQRFSVSLELQQEEVIASSESDLWNIDDNVQNWILTAGKVQNLRVAIKMLNGVEVPAGKIFSFWKHIGNPSSGRGYVVGREIREGCIVPTIAGGLCQLSNALYDAALKAGFEIIERHKHTRVIKGSLAEINRDATVKWNYIDLRFSAPHAFRVEAGIDAEKLVVKFKSISKNKSADKDSPKVTQAIDKLNDCYSCGNFECFKHPGKSIGKKGIGITTFVIDERWPEYDDYIQGIAEAKDHFVVPFLAGQKLRISRYVWRSVSRDNSKTVSRMALYRSLYIRAIAKSGKNIFSATIDLDRKIAREMAKHIPFESTHLVISQNLLPYLWADGVLGGRTFDVLMTRLPMEKLHERLDMAYKKYSESPTLNDFRAPDELISAENAALTKSRKIITPHAEIADVFNNKSVQLEWKSPPLLARSFPLGTKILFPGSALGRKGAYEVRKLARELGLQLVIGGEATETDSFWDGCLIEKEKTNSFENIRLVIYPAYVEHQPRLLLRANALSIPVITTPASGLSESENVSVIPIGDYDALKQMVQEKLNHLQVLNS